MSQDTFIKVLDKLTESFDDFKERLIRIEENVKDVKNVKSDVDDLKIKYASLESKATSAHKRMDGMDGKVATKKDMEDVAARVGNIEKNINKFVWIILTVVILAVLGTVVITN